MKGAPPASSTSTTSPQDAQRLSLRRRRKKEEERRLLQEARQAAKPDTPFEDPVFRLRVHDERMRRHGIDGSLARPQATGHAMSIEAIKTVMCRLVATDPAFNDPSLLEKPTDIGVGENTGRMSSTLGRTRPSRWARVSTTRLPEVEPDFVACSAHQRGNGTGAEFLAAHKGMVGPASNLLGFWLRHSGAKNYRSGRCTREAPALETDTGGWFSVTALIHRLGAIYGVSNTIHPYSILGIVWGVPQVRFHVGFVTALGRRPAYEFIRA